MTMPGRSYSSDGYRYGFNGKEKDKDMNSLTAYDYGFRIYNPAIGRFLSVDPLAQSYPYYTPYQFAGNDPIQNIDLDGAEEFARNYVSWSIAQANMQQIARENKAKNPPIIDTKPDRPLIPPVHSEAPSQQIKNSQRTAMLSGAVIHVPQKFQPGPSFIADNRLPWQQEEDRQRSEAITASIERNKQLEGIMADPISKCNYLNTSIGRDIILAPVEAIDHGIADAREGNWGGVALNTLKLGLSVAPFVPIKGIGIGPMLPSRLARVIPEEFASGSSTLAKAGDLDAFVVDATALKGLTTSEQIAQKLTLLSKDGSLVKGPFRVIEFDTPIVGLAQPINRLNTGFVNGGKTLGGATEYVIPNAPINSLKNVTQAIFY